MAPTPTPAPAFADISQEHAIEVLSGTEVPWSFLQDAFRWNLDETKRACALASDALQKEGLTERLPRRPNPDVDENGLLYKQWARRRRVERTLVNSNPDLFDIRRRYGGEMPLWHTAGTLITDLSPQDVHNPRHPLETITQQFLPKAKQRASRAEKGADVKLQMDDAAQQEATRSRKRSSSKLSDPVASPASNKQSRHGSTSSTGLSALGRMQLDDPPTLEPKRPLSDFTLHFILVLPDSKGGVTVRRTVCVGRRVASEQDETVDLARMNKVWSRLQPDIDRLPTWFDISGTLKSLCDKDEERAYDELKSAYTAIQGYTWRKELAIFKGERDTVALLPAENRIPRTDAPDEESFTKAQLESHDIAVSDSDMTMIDGSNDASERGKGSGTVRFATESRRGDGSGRTKQRRSALKRKTLHSEPEQPISGRTRGRRAGVDGRAFSSPSTEGVADQPVDHPTSSGASDMAHGTAPPTTNVELPGAMDLDGKPDAPSNQTRAGSSLEQTNAVHPDGEAPSKPESSETDDESDEEDPNDGGSVFQLSEGQGLRLEGDAVMDEDEGYSGELEDEEQGAGVGHEQEGGEEDAGEEDDGEEDEEQGTGVGHKQDDSEEDDSEYDPSNEGDGKEGDGKEDPDALAPVKPRLWMPTNLMDNESWNDTRERLQQHADNRSRLLPQIMAKYDEKGATSEHPSHGGRSTFSYGEFGNLTFEDWIRLFADSHDGSICWLSDSLLDIDMGSQLATFRAGAYFLPSAAVAFYTGAELIDPKETLKAIQEDIVSLKLGEKPADTWLANDMPSTAQALYFVWNVAGSHWVAVEAIPDITSRKGVINVYDSAYTPKNRAEVRGRMLLPPLMNLISGRPALAQSWGRVTEWTVAFARCSQQSDGESCGLFASDNCLRRLRAAGAASLDGTPLSASSAQYATDLRIAMQKRMLRLIFHDDIKLEQQDNETGSSGVKTSTRTLRRATSPVTGAKAPLNVHKKKKNRSRSPDDGDVYPFAGDDHTDPDGMRRSKWHVRRGRFIQKEPSMPNPPENMKVEVDDSIVVKKCDWLSSAQDAAQLVARAKEMTRTGDEVDDVIEDADADKLGAEITNPYMIDTKRFPVIARFFGFNEEDYNPRSGIYFIGWNKKYHLKLYQMIALETLLTRYLLGHDWAINALDTGLGKTPTTLSLLHVIMELQPMFEGMRKNFKGEPVTGPLRPIKTEEKVAAFREVLERRAAEMRKSDPTWKGTPADLYEPGDDDWEEPCEKREPYFDASRLVGGRTPDVRGGLMLIMAGPNLLGNWVSETNKFIEDDRIVKVVIQANGLGPFAKRSAKFKGCLDWQDEIPIARLASIGIEEEVSELDHGGKDWSYWKKRKNIPVKYLISDDQPRSWHRFFWVFASTSMAPRVLANELNTLKEKRTEDRIWLQPGVITMDEFHQVVNPSTAVWNLVAGFQASRPFVVACSATPWNKFEGLAGLLFSSTYRWMETRGWKQVRFGKFWQKEYGTWGKNGTARLTKSELSEEEHVRLDPDIHLYESQRHCITRDSYLDKHARFTAASSSGQVDRTVEAKKAAVVYLRRWSKHRIIQISGDAVIQTRPDKPGGPAAEKPPHSAWDVQIPVEPEYAPLLDQWWNSREQLMFKKLPNGEVKYSGAYPAISEQAQVLALFPCLLKAMQTDKRLENLMNKDCKAPQAQHQTELGSKSTVWRYMNDIHKLRSVRTVVGMVDQLRGQTNFFGYARKMIIAAFKPMAAAIFNLYLDWLFDQKHGRFTDAQDKVFIESGGSIESKRVNEANIERFKTTQTTKKGYRDRPWLMMAYGSAIVVGHNLSPAEVVISLDSNFHTWDIQQLIMRVNRDKSIQKSPHTFSFRIIPYSPAMQVGLVNAMRESDRRKVTDEILSAASKRMEERRAA